MRDDGTLEGRTMQLLAVSSFLTSDLDTDEAIMVYLEAAAVTITERTGVSFEEAHARIRDLADALSVPGDLH